MLKHALPRIPSQKVRLMTLSWPDSADHLAPLRPVERSRRLSDFGINDHIDPSWTASQSSIAGLARSVSLTSHGRYADLHRGRQDQECRPRERASANGIVGSSDCAPAITIFVCIDLPLRSNHHTSRVHIPISPRALLQVTAL